MIEDVPIDWLFGIQKRFGKEFFKAQGLDLDVLIKGLEGDKLDWNKEYILAMSRKVNGLLDNFDWKMHATTDQQTIQDNLLEDIVDIVKYTIAIAILNGFDTKDFIRKFDEKSTVVDAKFRQQQTIEKLKKSTHPIALIDIDGVIAQYPKPLMTYFALQVGDEEWIDKQPSDFLRHNPTLFHELKREYRLSGRKSQVPIVPGIRTFMNWLKSNEYTIVLLTARPYDKIYRIYADTLKFLSENNIPYDCIIWNENKGQYAVEHLGSANVEFAIDDEVLNANEFAYNGIRSYLFNPSGEEVSGVLPDVHVIKNFVEVTI
jgi:sRNA-binding regulator protein Hfq